MKSPVTFVDGRKLERKARNQRISSPSVFPSMPYLRIYNSQSLVLCSTRNFWATAFLYADR